MVQGAVLQSRIEPIVKRVTEGIGISILVSAVIYGLAGICSEMYVGATRTISKFETEEGYKVTRQSYSPYSASSMWLPWFVDKNGWIQTEIRMGNNRVTLVDENYTGKIEDAKDYIVAGVKGKDYRFYGNGTVTEDKDRGALTITDKSITSQSTSILAQWNAVLEKYGKYGR